MEKKKKLLSPFIAGLIAVGGLGAGIICGPTIGDTLSTWSKPASVQGQVITNGNIAVESVGVVSIQPGAREGVSGWDDKPTAACESPGQPKELGEVAEVTTGAYDKSFALSFPVTFTTEGNNLVAVGEVEGAVKQTGNKDLYEFSNWELVDNAGKPVHEVKSGTYVVRANVARNVSRDNANSIISEVGTSQDNVMTLDKVTVTIKQER